MALVGEIKVTTPTAAASGGETVKEPTTETINPEETPIDFAGLANEIVTGGEDGEFSEVEQEQYASALAMAYEKYDNAVFEFTYDDGQTYSFELDIDDEDPKKASIKNAGKVENTQETKEAEETTETTEAEETDTQTNEDEAQTAEQEKSAKDKHFEEVTKDCKTEEEKQAAILAEQKKILDGLFTHGDTPFTEKDGFKMPDINDPLWDRVQYETNENGETNYSLTIKPQEEKDPAFNTAWGFSKKFFPDKRYSESNLPTGSVSEFYWKAQGNTYSSEVETPTNTEDSSLDPNASTTPETGATTTPANETQQESATPETTATPNGSTVAPPDDIAKPEVDLTIDSVDGEAEGYNLTIGGQKIATLLSDAQPDENEIYKGQTSGNPPQYVVAKPNEDGSVTVSYHNYCGDGVAIQETPASVTQYNKNGSKVETAIDENGNVTESKTSADGQNTTTITKDDKLTQVSVNGETYGKAEDGNWYQLNSNGEIIQNSDGSPKAQLQNEPKFENGNLVVTAGNNENPYVRTYNPDGSLKEVKMGKKPNEQTYDMSEYKATPKYKEDGSLSYMQYEKYLSEDGEKVNYITTYPSGNYTISKANNSDFSGVHYGVNGELLKINPSGIDDTDPTKDEEQFWIDTSSMTPKQEDGSYTDNNGNIYIKNPDGTYSLDKSMHSNYNESNDSQDIKVGGDTISLKHDGDFTNDKEKNNYSGYTTEEPSRYAVVTTGENGTKVEYYASKEAFENSEAQSSSTEYKNDGSKVETTTQEVDGKTTTTTKTTDKNGNTTTNESWEVKDENGKVVKAGRTSTSPDGSKTTVTHEVVDGEIHTKVQIDNQKEVEVPYKIEQGDKRQYIEYNQETGEIRYINADCDAEGNFSSYIAKIYGSNGSLSSVATSDASYNLKNYQKNDDGSYTRIVTTDGSIQEKITFDDNGNMTVTTIEKGKDNHDSCTYDKYGNLNSATINGITYKINSEGKAVDSQGNVAGYIQYDDTYGRYKIIENLDTEE